MNTKMESESTPLSKSQKHSGSLEISKEYQETLNHLVLMASTQGWKDHAWYRAKELDAHPTGIWRGIANDLVKTMKEINAKTKE
jgi:hypothetical protein